MTILCINIHIIRHHSLSYVMSSVCVCLMLLLLYHPFDRIPRLPLSTAVHQRVQKLNVIREAGYTQDITRY